MKDSYGREQRVYTGWIIISIIIILIISTIFIGQFFKSEEKIKLVFKNGQIVSFLVFTTNKENMIKGCFVLLFHTKTNRCSIITILPKTYINFEDYLNSVSKLIDYNINYYICIEKTNLIKLIDIIGGVEIDSEGFKLPSLKINIPQGKILLDGDKSIEYLSFMIDNEENYEYKHLKRIQDYLKGLLILKKGFFEGLDEKLSINYLYKTIKTNISVNEFVI